MVGDKTQHASRPFFDPVESEFYGYTVRRLLSRHLASIPATRVVELGSGTGAPVVDAIARTGFRGHIHGWDINTEAVAVSNTNASEAGLETYYRVTHGDFFDARARRGEHYVIGNPPYLPCLTKDIANPELWGGEDGNQVARRALSLKFSIVMLIVSSFADPSALLQHAASEGYRVIDWAVLPLTMGRFSREPPVYRRILELQDEGRAYAREMQYAIAGVTWQAEGGDDKADQVLRALEAAGEEEVRPL